MPRRRKDTPKTTYQLRTAVTELIHWLREGQGPDPDVIVQALWLITLDGVANSGVPRGTSAKVLRLKREGSHGEVHPKHALELLKGWEHGPID